MCFVKPIQKIETFIYMRHNIPIMAGLNALLSVSNDFVLYFGHLNRQNCVCRHLLALFRPRRAEETYLIAC